MKKFILNKILKSRTIWRYLAEMISKLAEKKGLNAAIIKEIVLLFGHLVTGKNLSEKHSDIIAQIKGMDSSRIA